MTWLLWPRSIGSLEVLNSSRNLKERGSGMRSKTFPKFFSRRFAPTYRECKKRLRIELYCSETIANKAFAPHPEVLAPARIGYSLNSSESAIKISGRSLVLTLQMHYVHEREKTCKKMTVGGHTGVICHNQLKCASRLTKNRARMQ